MWTNFLAVHKHICHYEILPQIYNVIKKIKNLKKNRKEKCTCIYIL